MKYRTFGRLDKQVSVLGFGCMRLPVVGTDATGIDEPKATDMLRYAIDCGVNYVDTGYMYHNGSSELFVVRALQDGYRQRVNLVTKLATWLVKTEADFDRLLNEQLQKLQTDHLDFYLLHALNKSSWPKVRDLGVLRWAEGAVADGRIGGLGFSFHDSYACFKEIVDAYDGWALCQIQYNYIDEGIQAGTAGLKYAASKGLAVVVMEPIRGGRLGHLPEPVKEILDKAGTNRTQADWALQWVWHHPEVSVVLSGMNTMQQVVENLGSADRAAAGSLSADELEGIAEAREKYRELCPIPCTECRYCMPCPNDVLIHHNLALYNLAVMHGELELARQQYAFGERSDKDIRAAACLQCRECEELCPQGILISEWMPKIHAVLGEGQPPPGSC